jgi:hypothetical protein
MMINTNKRLLLLVILALALGIASEIASIPTLAAPTYCLSRPLVAREHADGGQATSAAQGFIARLPAGLRVTISDTVNPNGWVSVTWWDWPRMRFLRGWVGSGNIEPCQRRSVLEVIGSAPVLCWCGILLGMALGYFLRGLERRDG